MITLGPSDTLAAGAGTGSVVTYSLFGMELLVSAGTPTYKRLVQGQLASSPATIYTAPANTASFLSKLTLYNTSSSTVTVTVYAGGTSAANRLYTLALVAYGAAVIDAAGIHRLDSIGRGAPAGAQLVDATVTSNAIGLGPSTGASTIPAMRDHVHMSCGGLFSLKTEIDNLHTNTYLSLIAFEFPPGMLRNGTVLRAWIAGVWTSTNGATPASDCVFGPGGMPILGSASYMTNCDVAMTGLWGNQVAGSAYPWQIDGYLTIRGTTGSYATIQACWVGKNMTGLPYGALVSSASTGGSIGSGQIDLSAQNFINVTFLCPAESTSGLWIAYSLLEILKI